MGEGGTRGEMGREKVKGKFSGFGLGQEEGG